MCPKVLSFNSCTCPPEYAISECAEWESTKQLSGQHPPNADAYAASDFQVTWTPIETCDVWHLRQDCAHYYSVVILSTLYRSLPVLSNDAYWLLDIREGRPLPDWSLHHASGRTGSVSHSPYVRNHLQQKFYWQVKTLFHWYRDAWFSCVVAAAGAPSREWTKMNDQSLMSLLTTNLD